MKRLRNIIFLLSMIIVSGYNAGGKNLEQVVISGRIEKGQHYKVSLMKVVDGKFVELATSMPDSEGRFGFCRYIKENGFYFIGDDYASQRVYLKKGEYIQIVSSKEEFYFEGDVSKENQYLEEWSKMILDLYNKSKRFDKFMSNYSDFFPLLEEVENKRKQFVKMLNSGNTNFDEELAFYSLADVEYLALNFLYTPRTKHPKREDLVTFYKEMAKRDNFQSSLLMNVPYLHMYMSNYTMFTNSFIADKPCPMANLFKESIGLISNEILKGEYVMHGLNRTRTADAFFDRYKPFKQYLVTDSQKERAGVLERKFRSFNTGAKAVGFKLPDAKGNQVSLDDFKGKIVLLDFWATWCAPCKREMPYVAKLQEKYKNKPFTVIGISTDREKEKWLKYLDKNEMHGIQLWAGGDPDLSKDYSITTIPRFILIDQDGKIINVKAPKPSKPELDQMIKDALRKRKKA